MERGGLRIARGKEPIAQWLARLNPELRFALLTLDPALALSAGGIGDTFGTGTIISALHDALTSFRLPPEEIHWALPEGVRTDPQMAAAISAWLTEGVGGPAMRPQLWCWASGLPRSADIATLARADLANPCLPPETRLTALHCALEHADAPDVALSTLLPLMQDDARTYSRALSRLTRSLQNCCELLPRIPTAFAREEGLGYVISRLATRVTEIQSGTSGRPVDSWRSTEIQDYCATLVWLLKAIPNSIDRTGTDPLEWLERSVCKTLPDLVAAPQVVETICRLALDPKATERLMTLLQPQEPSAAPVVSSPSRLGLAVALFEQRDRAGASSLHRYDELTFISAFARVFSDEADGLAAHRALLAVATTDRERRVCDALLDWFCRTHHASLKRATNRPPRFCHGAVSVQEVSARLRALLEAVVLPVTSGHTDWPGLGDETTGHVTSRACHDAFQAIDRQLRACTPASPGIIAPTWAPGPDLRDAVMRMSVASGSGVLQRLLIRRFGDAVVPALLDGWTRYSELAFTDTDRVASAVYTIDDEETLDTITRPAEIWYRAAFVDVAAGLRHADPLLLQVGTLICGPESAAFVSSLETLGRLAATKRATTADLAMLVWGIGRLGARCREYEALRLARWTPIDHRDLNMALLQALQHLWIGWSPPASRYPDEGELLTRLAAAYRRIAALDGSGIVTTSSGCRVFERPAALVRGRVLEGLAIAIADQSSDQRLFCLGSLVSDFPAIWSLQRELHRAARGRIDQRHSARGVAIREAVQD